MKKTGIQLLGLIFGILAFMQISCMNKQLSDEEIKDIVIANIRRASQNRQYLPPIAQQINTNVANEQLDLNSFINRMSRTFPQTLPFLTVFITAITVHLYCRNAFTRGLVRGFFPIGGTMISLNEVALAIRYKIFSVAAKEAAGNALDVAIFQVLYEFMPSEQREAFCMVCVCTSMIVAFCYFSRCRGLDVDFLYLLACLFANRIFNSPFSLSQKEAKIAFSLITAAYVSIRMYNLRQRDALNRPHLQSA